MDGRREFGGLSSETVHDGDWANDTGVQSEGLDGNISIDTIKYHTGLRTPGESRQMSRAHWQ